jgi:ubiquitin-like-conjugating enzyme ATG3
MDKIGNFIGEAYRSVAKNVMGVLKESKFYSEGVLTPEEYVVAGDFLVQKCPTWKWCGGSSNNTKLVDYLPENKQYLVTTVPCPRRARDYEKSNKTTEQVNEDDWVEPLPDVYNRKTHDDHPLDLESELDNTKNKSEKNVNVVVNNPINTAQMGIEGIEISEEDESNNKNNKNFVNENNNDQNFDFIVVEEEDQNVIRTRTYDVSVTYDYYYRVPRMWLTGYDENGTPLSDEDVKEDIMLDYVDKTVTIELHPHTNVKSISIHPCKHSLLLTKMIENFENNGKKLEVHMSVLLFLKFLHSVVPTIEYDFTMDINF